MNQLYTLLNDLETDVEPLDQVTLARITAKARAGVPGQAEVPGRGKRQAKKNGLRVGIAVAAALLLITAVAAAAVPLWNAFFGGLDVRQQEIIGGMEVAGPEPPAEATRQDTLLPPPVSHDGVTITPLRILGAKNRLYLVLEIRVPEGTVFHENDVYFLRTSPKRPENAPGGMVGFTGGFTALEAGTTEPNVLVGVLDETASVDLGGWTYQIRELSRRTADGEEEVVFTEAENGTWDIPIPEDLNGDRVLELPVEGMTLTQDGKHMTLLSMHVSPLGIWWQYRLEGEDPWPEVRMALRMKDGSEIEAAPGQLTMGDMGEGLTGTVSFEKPVDLSEAEAVLWEDTVIPLEPAE